MIKQKKYIKKHNPNKIKKGQSYTVQDIVEVLSVHKNSVQRWFRIDGLQGFKQGNKNFTTAAALKAFIIKKNNQGKNKCKETQLYCVKCKKAIEPLDGLVDLVYWAENRINLRGLCPICNNLSHKAGALEKVNLYHQLFNVQTLQEPRLIGIVKSSGNGIKKE